MNTDDLEQVHLIEELSFPSPWSVASFSRELTENPVARYLVLAFDNFIVAYAGVWLILDEGHITNVAVHPEFRGRGLGKEILRSLLKLCTCYGVRAVTLEVRPSNDIALALYHSLGFHISGIRKGYYTDTQEDALIMWLEGIDQITVSEEECCHVFAACREALVEE
ncbi:MAG: ribosomal protein S18-alanine N-acetyltransferase [Symbiobacteriaceae bacterium]|nr:ribosomal protein S18-alanine N-acetyltransferase [Symbiobacteriaceae bacterium]